MSIPLSIKRCEELEKHSNHTCSFLFEGKVMIMGMKDGIIQLWREENSNTTKRLIGDVK